MESENEIRLLYGYGREGGRGEGGHCVGNNLMAGDYNVTSNNGNGENIFLIESFKERICTLSFIQINVTTLNIISQNRGTTIFFVHNKKYT